MAAWLVWTVHDIILLVARLLSFHQEKLFMWNLVPSYFSVSEPEDCNIKAAGMCMFNYIAMTTHAAFIPIKDRPGTCW